MKAHGDLVLQAEASTRRSIAPVSVEARARSRSYIRWRFSQNSGDISSESPPLTGLSRGFQIQGTIRFGNPTSFRNSKAPCLGVHWLWVAIRAFLDASASAVGYL